MRPEDDVDEFASKPLPTPTGPGGAKNYRNWAGSQIATPHVTNVYLGDFWSDKAFFEGFSKAIIENGYLDPLRQLGYGTGSGSYLGSTSGPTIPAGAQFDDSDARILIAKLLDTGVLHADANTLFMMLLPDGVTSKLGDSTSCGSFCGYHEAFNYHGTDVAYAVLPSSTGCDNCMNGDIRYFTSYYAHELVEACTDKIPGKGWISEDGLEAADLESAILFPWGPPNDPQRYIVQGYYTIEQGNTVGAWRDTGVAIA
jgi:hypothetical protein